MCLSGQESEPSVLEMFSLPNWIGESLKFLNSIISMTRWNLCSRSCCLCWTDFGERTTIRGGAEEKVQLVEQEAQRSVHAPLLVWVVKR